MKGYQVIHTFKKGQLDQSITARNDIESYYEGALKLENFVSLAQGGVERRGGLRYIDDVNEDGILINYSFNKDQRYCIFIGVNNINIYRLGTNGIYYFLDNITSPYTSLSDIKELRSSFNGDVVLLTHKEYPPKRLERSATDTWSITDQLFEIVPQWDFDDGNSPASSDCVIQFTTVSTDTNSQFVIGLNGFFTDPFNTEADGFYKAVLQAISQLPNISTGDSNIAILQNSNVITLTLKGKNQNEYIVSSFVSTGNGTFDSDVTTQGTTRKEDIWSSVRGYPAAVSIFAGRLWLGGMKSVPSVLCGSRSEDYFNFDQGTGLDHQAISVGLSSNQLNPISHIVSTRNLQILTEGAEFGLTNDSLTPAKANLFEQTNNGCSNCRPASIEGQTFFIRSDGNSLIGFVYQREQQSYVSYNSSILNPSIIKNPSTMSVLRGLKENDATYILMTNEDGTITVLNILVSENILSFTTWTTDGEFLSASSNIDDAAFLVKRTIGGMEKYYIEQLDENLITDSAITSTTGDVDGTRLIGETVDLIGDGNYKRRVPASSNITDTEGDLNLEIGLRYETKLRPMPAYINQQNGKAFGDPVRISRAYVMTDGYGVKINGRLAQKRETDSLQGAQLYRFILLHWRNLATLEITQSDPSKITIYSLQMEVS